MNSESSAKTWLVIMVAFTVLMVLFWADAGSWLMRQIVTILSF